LINTFFLDHINPLLYFFVCPNPERFPSAARPSLPSLFRKSLALSAQKPNSYFYFTQNGLEIRSGENCILWIKRPYFEPNLIQKSKQKSIWDPSLHPGETH
jgi:hypothetical protein